MAGLPFYTHSFLPRPYCSVDLHRRTPRFCLAYACLAAGLVPAGAKTHSEMNQLVREAFSGDVQKFLDAAASIGCDQHAISEAASRLGIVHVVDTEHALLHDGVLICTDVALTVAVLSRHTGSMVLRDRPPVLTWAQLFGRVVRIPEPIVPCTSATWAGER
jgi:hypothetical protein